VALDDLVLILEPHAPLLAAAVLHASASARRRLADSHGRALREHVARRSSNSQRIDDVLAMSRPRLNDEPSILRRHEFIDSLARSRKGTERRASNVRARAGYEASSGRGSHGRARTVSG